MAQRGRNGDKSKNVQKESNTMGRVSLRKIEQDISSLSSREQLLLVERLIHRIRTAEPLTGEIGKTSWEELYGLGKGVWHGQDAQDHVASLREDR